MKKINANKSGNWFNVRCGDFLMFQLAAFSCLFLHKKTVSKIHNKLMSRYMYIIERSDIGEGTYKRWLKSHGDRLNQSDCRKLLSIIRGYFKILIGEVK